MLNRTKVRPAHGKSDKCVRLGAGRSQVRLSARSCQDLVNWYCNPLTRRTLCRRAAGNTPRTKKNDWTETRICTNSVVVLQDHCRYTAPATNHHIKKHKKTKVCLQKGKVLLRPSVKHKVVRDVILMCSVCKEYVVAQQKLIPVKIPMQP